MSETSSVERQVRLRGRTAKLVVLSITIGWIFSFAIAGFIDLLSTLWVWSGGKTFAFCAVAAPVISVFVYRELADE